MSKVVIRQFVLAIALVVLYRTVTMYHAYAAHPQFADRMGGLGIALLFQVPWSILAALPIAVGVALSLLPDGRGAFRQGMLIAGGVTALLVLNDLVARDFWQGLGRREMGDRADAGPPARFDDTTSALHGAVLHLLGRVQAGDIEAWPPPAPTSVGAPGMFSAIQDPEVIVRMSAVLKYREALHLFIPLFVGGLVVGAGTWVRRVATFHAQRDERLFRLALGWVLGLGVVYGLLALGSGSIYTLTSPKASLAWLAVPYLVAAIPATLGWWALRQRDDLAGA